MERRASLYRDACRGSTLSARGPAEQPGRRESRGLTRGIQSWGTRGEGGGRGRNRAGRLRRIRRPRGNRKFGLVRNAAAVKSNGSVHMLNFSTADTVPLLVVIVHCLEPLNGVLHILRAHRLPFIIYHKSSARCRPPRLVDIEPYGELVLMPHNLGRECSGYLRFIVERYERTLPQMIAFLQAGAEMHLPFTRGGLWPSLRPLLNTTSGFVSLSKNSFEGRWPAPCESARQIPAFLACHQLYWSELSADGPEAGQPPPTTFRFYANGLFAVSGERIRRRPRALYEQLLDRLEGRAPLRCLHPSNPQHAAYAPWVNKTDRIAPSEIDCLMLEKTWHVLFGERATMPPPEEYNADGGRFGVADLKWISSHGSRIRVSRIRCEEGGKAKPKG